MPKKDYVEESIMATIIGSLYFTYLYMNALITFISFVVAEKEKKIKETMRMMGMYDSAFW
jgi:hypothetical protein